ncbi:hypothetical protein COB52_04700 [Candidatus Kaiserbacteria bacterium]|nr:MAG: hypothetical protein COB52_04700 [Candidatus Kaiserbacteria bacterium]
MFLASKNEEIYSPRCEDFAVATANGFNSDDIFQCEKDIVRSLNWRLSPPSLNQWA